MDRPSKYMLKKFNEDFSEPQKFWTSEDGNLVCFVTRRSPNAISEIKDFFNDLGINWSKCKFYDAFVYKEHVGNEFYDGGSQSHGFVWRITEEDTGMPVTVCDL
jgi:hypothetical protein